MPVYAGDGSAESRLDDPRRAKGDGDGHRESDDAAKSGEEARGEVLCRLPADESIDPLIEALVGFIDQVFLGEVFRTRKRRSAIDGLIEYPTHKLECRGFCVL